MIEADQVYRSYTLAKKKIEVLRGVNLKIESGEKVFLCGPRGAGKTTLMYTSIIFADEPTGNLDSANGEEIMNILMEVVEEQKATLVVVTHDTSLSTLGDRVLTIKDGIVVDD